MVNHCAVLATAAPNGQTAVVDSSARPNANSNAHPTTSGASTERRPIRARESGWAKAVTHRLVALGISPNAISASSILFGILGAAAFAATSLVDRHAITAALFAAAALCMQLRLLANMFDGMVALECGGPRHPLGALWNELPDRAADACFLVGAGYGLGGSPTLGWLAALMAVLTAYVRAQGAAAGARHHFSGPMAKPHRMALMTGVALLAAALPPTAHASFATTFDWAPVGPVGVALLIVSLGSILTIVRRTTAIAADLRAAKKEPE